MTELQQFKLLLAEQFLRHPNDPTFAVMQVTNDNIAEIVQQYQFDPEVITFKEALLKEYGPEHFLPSKTELVHTLMSEARKCILDKDAAVKYYKLISDIMGFVEKKNTQVNLQINNKVMAIPNANISVDEWEQKAIEQQTALSN